MHLATLLLPLATFAVAACGGQQRAAATDDADPRSTAVGTTAYTSVSLRQGACFGTCPVYTITVQPDGAAAYRGRNYAPRKGEFAGSVPADSLAAINAAVAAVLAQADALPREIESDIMDLSRTTITLVDAAGDTLTFAGTLEFAPPVAELRARLSALPEAVAWTRVPGSETPPPHHVEVTLQAADQIQTVTEDFFRQQMRVVRMTSTEPPVFLLRFDPYAASLQEVMRDLKRQPAVVAVRPAEAPVGEGD